MLVFFDLPSELRCLIYHDILHAHFRVRNDIQPDNAHLRLLRTCRLVASEARPILAPFVSLRHERQIQAFIRRVAGDAGFASAVLWADVANDGRWVIDASNGKVRS
jgi:hypothetical protein